MIYVKSMKYELGTLFTPLSDLGFENSMNFTCFSANETFLQLIVILNNIMVGQSVNKSAKEGSMFSKTYKPIDANGNCFFLSLT